MSLRFALVALLVCGAPSTAWGQAQPPEEGTAPDAPTIPSDVDVVPHVPVDPFGPWLARERPPPLQPHIRKWFAQMDIGPYYQRLYDLSIVGAQLGVHAARDAGPLAFTLGGQFAFGRVEPGLSFSRVGIGFGLDVPAGIVRVGGQFGFGILNISSVTMDGGSSAGTMDLVAHATVDVARLRDDGKTAVYVGAQLFGSLVLASDAAPWVWGPVAVFGARL